VLPRQCFRTNRNYRRARHGRCKKSLERRKDSGRDSSRRLKGSAETRTLSSSVIPTAWTSACWTPWPRYSIRYFSCTLRWVGKSPTPQRIGNSSEHLWSCTSNQATGEYLYIYVSEWRGRCGQNRSSHDHHRYGRFRYFRHHPRQDTQIQVRKTFANIWRFLGNASQIYGGSYRMRI